MEVFYSCIIMHLRCYNNRINLLYTIFQAELKKTMIIAFIGDIGSGKTLSMVRFIISKIKRYNRKAFINFSIDLGKTYNKNVELLDNKFYSHYAASKFKIYNSIVAIDEAHVYYDSRNSMSSRNKQFKNFINQSRKRGVDLIYTTQDFDPLNFCRCGQVDKRLRDRTNRIVLCKSVIINGIQKILNFTYRRDGRLLNKIIFDAPEFYKYYDTYEIIDFEEDKEEE